MSAIFANVCNAIAGGAHVGGTQHASFDAGPHWTNLPFARGSIRTWLGRKAGGYQFVPAHRPCLQALECALPTDTRVSCQRHNVKLFTQFGSFGVPAN